MDNLDKEFQHYLANKEEYLKQYEGKVIVIMDSKVIGVYGDRTEAINEAKKSHKLGTFLVQQVSREEDQVRFHSRYAG